MKNRHLNMLLSAFTLTFIICVLGAALVALPVFPKLGSRGYWVTLLFGLGLSSVIAFGLTGVVALIPKRFAPWIILCLQVLCIVAFVVTVFFPRGIALLDGRPLFTSPEGIWAGYGILTALLMGLGYRYATVFKRAFNIVVIMSVGTVSYVFYRAGLLDAVEREAFGKQAIPIEALYEFGSQNNVIVILMDMLQGSFVEQALLRDLDTKNKYSDFNVYTRAISTFPFTNYSLPNILSGQTYASHDNPKFLPNMLAAVNDSFITDAQNHGYQTIGVQSYPELPAAKQNIEAFHVYSDPSKKPLSYFEYILKHNSVNLSCGSAMRVFKTNICKYFGHEEELDKLKESSKNILMQWAARGYVGQEREKLFFVHNFLTHAPIVYNKSGQRYVDIGQYPWTHENLLDEINYSLDLLNNVFERMKSLEIYNDALIVIIVDHGHFMGYHTPDVYTNVEDFEGYKTGANFRPATMYNPVIMIKPPHAKSGCISHAPIGLVGIRSIVNAYLKTEQVNLDSVLAEQRKRMPKIPVMTCLKEDDPYFSTKCHEFVYARENVSSLPALFAGLSQ